MDKETAKRRTAHMLQVCNALLRERRGMLDKEKSEWSQDGAMSAYSRAAHIFLQAQQVAERHPEAYAAAIQRIEEKMQEWAKGPPPSSKIFPPEWRGDYVNALRAVIELAKRNLDS